MPCVTHGSKNHFLLRTHKSEMLSIHQTNKRINKKHIVKKRAKINSEQNTITFANYLVVYFKIARKFFCYPLKAHCKCTIFSVMFPLLYDVSRNTVYVSHSRCDDTEITTSLQQTRHATPTAIDPQANQQFISSMWNILMATVYSRFCFALLFFFSPYNSLFHP